jgi:hypothetical protein
MVLSGKVVDTHALLQTVWVGLVAGVGLSGSYGLAMLGLYRAADARQAANRFAVLLYGTVGALALLIVVVGVVGGVLVISRN